jgi:hypothetical protein
MPMAAVPSAVTLIGIIRDSKKIFGQILGEGIKLLGLEL